MIQAEGKIAGLKYKVEGLDQISKEYEKLNTHTHMGGGEEHTGNVGYHGKKQMLQKIHNR